MSRAVTLALAIVIVAPAYGDSTTCRQMGTDYVCVTRHNDGRVTTTTCRTLGRETVCETR